MGSTEVVEAEFESQPLTAHSHWIFVDYLEALLVEMPVGPILGLEYVENVPLPIRVGHAYWI